jgi:CRP-like cAMP-binding protein
MFSKISEQRMHLVRWLLTISWALIILLLFYDPWTAILTNTNYEWSPFRLLNRCVAVQGICLTEQSYTIVPTILWGVILPSVVFILLVFGHELWRRICPLSFLSQIPRALTWQRQFRRENSTTGKVRYELAKVKSDSWLGRKYPYVQFGWLFAGLCGRILFFNANQLVLGGWLLFTCICAVSVGYLYSGKSWCNYFCPMAPVQRIYSMPNGLLGNKAHTSVNPITQSMCRVTLPDGKEQSSCVACQSSCIDIDSEKSYWDNLNRPEELMLRYGYLGLVIGYFLYYYLYAGNWDYYFSGAWARQPDQLTFLLSPGFYLFGQSINVPKLVAVPITLGLFTLIGYRVGQWIENRFNTRLQSSNISSEVVRHKIFTLCTFGAFNFFFIFSGRPLVQLMPLSLQYVYNCIIIFCSTAWIIQTWQRAPGLYKMESLASRFRKQLEKLNFNISEVLDGRSLADLNTNEVYVLARVLPGFNQEKRRIAYQGVVREALQEGYVNYSSSLEILQQLRQELEISDGEHQEVLEELGIEDPELLSPDRQRSLENQVRLSGYQKSLQRLMLLQNDQQNIDTFLKENSTKISNLRRQYSISSHEQAWILSGIDPEFGNVRRAGILAAQLPDLIICNHALNQPVFQKYHQDRPVLMLLKTGVNHKKELIIRAILEIFIKLQDDMSAVTLSRQLGLLSPAILLEILESEDWSNRLHPDILQGLYLLQGQSSNCSLEYSDEEIIRAIETLAYDQNPLIQASCVYIITKFDLEKGKSIARSYGAEIQSPLLKETTKILLLSTQQSLLLNNFPQLEKVAHLSNCDFFHRMHSEILTNLSNCAEVKSYTEGELITGTSHTRRNLLLLISGEAEIYWHSLDKSIKVEKITFGQIIDELEILAHSDSKNTLISTSNSTRLIVLPVDAFDDLLEIDQDFAQRVMELESRHIQKFIRSLQPID